MFPVDPDIFRVDLQNDIAYHMAREEGYSPQEALKNELNKEMEEYAAEQVEIEEALLQRIESVVGVLTSMLQAMQQNDPNGPARNQLDHLTHSILELEEAKAGSESDLLQAKNLLSTMKRQYAILKGKFEQLKQKHERATREDPLNSFVTDAGARICRSISVHSSRRN
jgi:exonuclease VII large subunit